MLMEARERTYTVDEFLALIEALPDDVVHDYELIAGEILEVSPSKARQTTIGALLLVKFGAYVLDNDLGYPVGADGGFKLSDEDFLAPDAAFIAKSKYPDGLPEDDYYTLAPDLAVEVVSASDQYSAHKKALRYIELGVRMVLVLYPKKRTIDVYQPAEGGALVKTLAVDDTFDGGEVLPGFKLAVSEIFPPVKPKSPTQTK